MAHEIGHFLGMKHDAEDIGTEVVPRKHKGKVCTSKNHLMIPEGDLSTMVKWSPCSRADFQAYYLSLAKFYGRKWCMEGNILKNEVKK